MWCGWSMHRKQSFGDHVSIRSREGVCRRRRRRQWVIGSIDARRWDASAPDGLSSRRRITNRRVPPLKRTFPKKKPTQLAVHDPDPALLDRVCTKRVSKTLDPVSQKPQSMKITLSSSESIGKTSRSRIPHGSIERTQVVFAEFWSVWSLCGTTDGWKRESIRVVFRRRRRTDGRLRVAVG